MRIGQVIAVAAAALGAAAPTAAQDWRAVPSFGSDIAFVDADSVVRRSGDRIAFQGRFLSDPKTAGNPRYDRVDLRVSGTCPTSADEDVRLRIQARFRLRGRQVAQPADTREDLRQDVGWIADQLCRGVIGYRRFASPEAAMAGYGQHGSPDRLAGYVSDEVVLTGTVVQGFEMNAVALCGSETGCVDDAPTEFCWLDGTINVPAPTGVPDWVGGGPRRDTADARFRGRIVRSRTGRGFGHLESYGCQVEQTGPAEFITITQRRPQRPEPSKAGEGAEALAAHAAMSALVSAAAPVTVTLGAQRWTVDELLAAPTRNGGSGACGTLLQRGGTYIQPLPPSPTWSQITAVRQAGAAVELSDSRYDESLSFHFGSPAQAVEVAAVMEKLRRGRVAGVEQAGRQVTLRLEGGGRELLRFADAGAAVAAAGIAAQLRGVEIAQVSRTGNAVSALPVRRYSFGFADAATAARAAAQMERLRAACAGG